MGVRLAFLFGTWIGANFTSDATTTNTAINDHSPSASLLQSDSPVVTVELLRLQPVDGHILFARYMQDSMALYGASNAELILSGDRVKVWKWNFDIYFSLFCCSATITIITTIT
jgi:hypothetical protein